MSHISTALEHGDLPAFFQAADRESLAGQRRYLLLNKAQLGALLVASIFGAVAQGAGAWSGVLAGLSFVVAVILRLHTGKARDDRVWYHGRAAAESTKTLAWRYAVRGRPFTAELERSKAKEIFLQQLCDVSSAVEHLAITPEHAPAGEISQRMDQLRQAPLSERIRAYKVGRLQDQQSWYAGKVKENNTLGRRWERLLLGVEVAGVVVAVTFAAGVVQIDLLGVVSTAGAAALAWVGVRQHEITATAYSVASNELARILTQPTEDISEEEWAAYVDESEDAISREHTLWVASRGMLPLSR